MKFLICGLGSIGRRHLRNLVQLGQQDIGLFRTGKSTLPEDDLADFPVENDLEQALARWQPQAVLVTNPTSLHLETALAAAKAGAHLFLEKPISHSLEGVEGLRTEVAERGLRALVGYQFRFHPTLMAAKELIDEAAIGRVLSATAHWGEFLPNWHPWEDYRQSYSARQDLGGGVVLTLSHPIDYLRWLLGEVTGVTASVAQPGALELAVESLANITMEHAGGVVSQLHLNYLQQPPRHELEIVGTKGTIRWRNEDGSLSWWREEGQKWKRQSPPEGFKRNSLFLDEMEHFIEVIDEGVEPRCSLADGEAALRIALAALEAGETGQHQQISEKAKA